MAIIEKNKIRSTTRENKPKFFDVIILTINLEGDKSWYLDNGASIDITINSMYFQRFNFISKITNIKSIDSHLYIIAKMGSIILNYKGVN